MFDQNIKYFRCSGEVDVDVPLFLTSYGCQKTARHCTAVAGKAIELAKQVHCNPSKAEQAGYLHDISVVIPTDQWINFAHVQSIEVLPEETQYPLILHQKLSGVLAREVFKVTDSEILKAIGCHTTLRLNPSMLDKVLFLADKIAWDQEDIPPYLINVLTALNHSLDLAVLVAASLGSDADLGGKLGNTFFKRIVKITYVPVAIFSLMMIYGIISGHSLYPRWMVVFLRTGHYLSSQNTCHSSFEGTFSRGTFSRVSQ